MSKWDQMRIKTNAADFDRVRLKIAAFPEKVTDYYTKQIDNIAADAVEVYRQVIEESVTPTGERRAERGGEPGRIETGTMYRSVTKRVRPRKGGLSIFVGWISGKPGYASFQENGFKHSGSGKYVAGMNAKFQVKEYIRARIQHMRTNSRIEL